MKFTVLFSLIIILQSTHAHKHKQRHENKPHHTTVSKASYGDRSSSRGLKINFPSSSIFPCPMPKDITPCSCDHSDELTLDCSDAPTDSSLQEVFDKYFPVKNFYAFEMYDNYNIKHLNQTHDIKFKYIHIVYSLLESITNSFLKASVPHIEKVFIVETQLTHFPLGQLQWFTSLESLTIWDAGLVKIPPIIGRKLNYIDFEDNAISSIDKKTFQNVPNLRTLYMSDNSIKSLKSNTIPVRSDMEEVYLNSNPISHIEPGAFYDGSKDLASAGLKNLYLFDCTLTTLGERTVPLTRLTDSIDLYGNAISSISPGAFFILTEPAPDSVFIDLSINALTTIDEGVFKGIMDYIGYLDFSDNPIDCDSCGVAWIVKDPSFMEKISTSTTCVNGVGFRALQPEAFDHCS